MKSLIACVTALGALLVASVALAIPTEIVPRSAEQMTAEVEIARSFQFFRDSLSAAFKRIVVIRDDSYQIILSSIVRRDDFSEKEPFEVRFGGRIKLEGKTPMDQYSIHLSTVHLRDAPFEYIQFTAAQIVCVMILGLAQEQMQEKKQTKLMNKCACVAVGKWNCMKVHYHLVRIFHKRQLSPPEVERYIAEQYDIQNFVWE